MTSYTTDTAERRQLRLQANLQVMPDARFYLEPGLRSGYYRSPGALAGLTDTGTERSSAVRMMRFCSAVWAAG